MLRRQMILGILVTVMLLATVGTVMAVGFNEWGYNYQARLFNGWYGQWGEWKANHRNPPGEHWSGATWDAWIVMKWSKDWTPEADEPVGAWVTNHWTWYTDDYASGWYGFEGRVTWTDHSVAPTASYLVVEFLKVQSVGCDETAWATYSAGGAYDAGWGTCENEVPRYVVFQDVISVYDTSTGALIATFNLATASPKGLGQPIF